MSGHAELFDRRQRALEAGHDAVGMFDQNPVSGVIEAAIETATRVRVDRAVCAAAWDAHEAKTGPLEGVDDAEFVNVLIAAFEAAGFEVED